MIDLVDLTTCDFCVPVHWVLAQHCVDRRGVIVHGSLFGVEHDERNEHLVQNYDLIWDCVKKTGKGRVRGHMMWRPHLPRHQYASKMAQGLGKESARPHDVAAAPPSAPVRLQNGAGTGKGECEAT